MTRWMRFRLWVARRALKGTQWIVASADAAEALQTDLWELYAYCEQSGGLAEPRRIKAKRRILTELAHLDRVAARLEVREALGLPAYEDEDDDRPFDS